MKTKYEDNEYLNVDVIQSFLDEKGITQKEFASLLHKEPQTVSGYMRHAQPFPKDKASRDRLCEVTGYCIERLLTKERNCRVKHKTNRTPSDKIVHEDRIPDTVPEKTANDIEEKPDTLNNVTIIVTVRDMQKDHKTRIRESRKKIIGALVLVALILCIIILQVEFNVFGGIEEDRLVNYPCLIFFSIAISLYGARETLVCDNDVIAKNITEKGAVLFGIAAFVWLWGITVIRVLLETGRGHF